MLRLSSLALLCTLGFTAFNAPARAEDAPAGDAPKHLREGKPGEGMRERIREKLFEGITLSDDQQVQLKKLHEAKEAEMKKFRDEHKAEFDAQKAWHEANQPKIEAAQKAMADAAKNKDREALRAAREDLKSIFDSRPKLDEKTKAAMPVTNLEKMAESIRAILTADQVKIFDANIKKLEAKKDEWKNRGPDGPGGPPPGNDGDKPRHRRHAKDADGPPADGTKPADGPKLE